ncbi:MAG: fibronectin type III domain-containing protein [Nitrospirota bacterium]
MRASARLLLSLLGALVGLTVPASAQTLNIYTVAGGGAGDGRPASEIALNAASGVAVDGVGNLYIADQINHRIRKMDAGTGVVWTIAGTGRMGFAGDGGPASAAQLNSPFGVAVDANGHVYVSDRGNHRLRRIDAVTGRIATVVGTGAAGLGGDGGPASAAVLNGPSGLAVDAAGALYVADTNNHRIRKVAGGVISTVAGGGTAGLGDGGAATAAQLAAPQGVSVEASGTLYIADTNNHRVRRVAGGVISTVAGSGSAGFSGDGGAATAAQLASPSGVAVASGELYIADTSNHRIRKVAGGVISTAAGGGLTLGDGGPASAAKLASPLGVFTRGRTLYIVDTNQTRIRTVDLDSGVITTVAGSGRPYFAGDGGPALLAGLNSPGGIAFDPAGHLYVADRANHQIRKVDAGTGVISTVVGTGTAGFSGDGGPATAANVNTPYDLVVDSAGTLYFTDQGNHRIRKVSAGSGVISTIAGTGSAGLSGDGGDAALAKLYRPAGLTIDASANLYVADSVNSRIRKIDATTGVITTVAGSTPAGVAGGFSGDGGPATLAELNRPLGVSINLLGDLFIADTTNNRIRRVDATGVISTVAGGGSPYLDDGSPATSVALTGPPDVVADPSGAGYYIADPGSFRVRRVGSDGLISTVAGTREQSGFAGDGGPATVALLNGPYGVGLDAAGTVYLSDSLNNRVRQVTAANQAPSFFVHEDVTVEAGSVRGGQVLATGPETADAVVLSAAGLPGFAVLTDHGDGTGVVTIAPPAGATGTYSAIVLSASDGVTAAAAPMTITVTAANQPPDGVIDAPSGDVTIAAGQSVTFAATGSDPDNSVPLAYRWTFGGGAADQSVEDPGAVVFPTPGTYTVTFTVTDALGLADPTPAARVITVQSAPPAAPTALSALDQTADNGGAIVLAWTPSTSAGVTEQRIYRSLTSGGSYSLVTSLAGNTANSYTHTGLTNGATYYYVVRAFNGTIESGDSNQASAAPVDNLAPAAPTGVSAADAAGDQGGALALSWMPSTATDVTAQRVYRSLTNGGPYTLVTSFANNTTNAYTDTGLANGTPYYYVVRAYDGTQESSNSTQSSAAPVDNLAPAAPMAVSAVDRPADNGGAIDLSWTPSTSIDVTQQRVYRSLTSGGPYTLITTIGNNTTGAYTDLGLSNGTTYYYVVRAFDATQESANSNQTSAIPADNAAAAPPTGLSAADVAGDQGGALALSWTPSTDLDVTAQRVYRSLTAGGPYSLVTNFANNTTAAYTDTGLTNGTTYYYVVRAFDGTQESANSNEASAVPVDNFAPAAPTALSATDVAADQGGALALSWTPSTDLDVIAQRVYRSTTTGGPYTLVTSVADNTTAAYTDTGLANGTPYYYVVRAFDGTQESADSTEASAAPVDNTALAAPTALSAADVTGDNGGALALNWTPSTSTDVTAQRVYRSTTAGGPYTLVTSFANNTTGAYTDTGLTNGATYYYVVRAFNGTLESANSNEASAAPVDNTAPAAPTGVSAADTPSDTGGAITVTWMPSSSTDVTSQRVYRSTTSGGPYSLVTSFANNTTNTHTDTGLTNGTTYSFVVRAFDGTQESANSNEASAVPLDNSVADAPTGLSAADTPSDNGGAINLAWTPSISAGVTEQRIYRSLTPGGPYSLVTSLAGNTASSYTHTGLTNGATYYYVVRAFNGTIESSDSNQASAAPVDNLAPAAPTGVNAVDTPADNGGAINLAWTPSTDLDVIAQRVYRSTTTGGPYTLVTSVADNTTAAYTDTGLANGTPYYYVVRAFDGTQESANSNQAAAAPLDNQGSNGETDTVPPVTTARPASGAYAADQPVTLVCADSQTGCAATYYTTDGTMPTTLSLPYSGPIPLGTNTIVRFFSRDHAGNTETVQTETYTVVRTLMVSKAGSGGGTVASTPTGIRCGGDCNDLYADGQSVTLTAEADAGSIFTGWSGMCSGTGTCILVMTTDRLVTATFTMLPTVKTGTVARVSATSATLTGMANAHGGAGSTWFEYGVTSGYGNSTSKDPLPVGGSDVTLMSEITSLSPGTSYRYRVCAQVSGQSVCGSDTLFTTRSSALGADGDISSVIAVSAARVDGYDLIALGLAFGADASMPNWNPLADLNGDGVVDGKDLTILAINFGRVQQ